jgi:hypothetical protein
MSVPHLDDDLRVLLHSPALTLEPPETLSDDVRRRARRHRTGTRIAAGGVTAALVVAGILVGPSLRGSVDDLRTHHGQQAGIKPDPRAPHATSEVVTLRIVNKAEILTWFEGAKWCTQTTRIKAQSACSGPADPKHPGFSWVVPVRSPSVTVDNQYYVAGIAPPGATRIVVHMSDGREFDTEIVSGAGFVMPVWSSVAINLSYGHVAYYAAYDATGREFAKQPA